MMPDLNQLSTQVVLFAAALGIPGLAFVAMFLVPGIVLRWKLGRLVSGFRTMVKAGRDPEPLFASDRTLQHLWTEFKDTLHEQVETNRGSGLPEVVALRSTVPAEMFFNAQSVVDNRLRTEFFKHLPGIFTGIGIIGTFYGLINGLQVFRISQNQAIVMESLNGLLHGVWHAFLVSALAISLAMVVTVIEKFIVASLYRRIEQLCHLIDSRFESGAGEEYLSRLVRSSEQQASQIQGLKDALVTEIREALRESVDRRIAAADQRARSDQGEALGRALGEALAGFGDRMERLLGAQTEGISQMQQRSVEALQAAVTALERTAVSSVDAVTGMNEGARALQLAATDFARAGAGTMGTLDHVAAAVAQLTRAADSVAVAARSLDGTVGDYQANRDVIARMVAELGGIVDAARREAALTSDVLERIDAAAKGIAAAGSDVEHYLDRVTDVLATSHSAFADNMQRVLGTANRQFYEELSRATGLLREGIQELEITLVEAPAAARLS